MNQIDNSELSSQDKSGIRKKNITYFWLTFLVIFLDQISKYLVRQNLELGRTIYVTPKLFWLTHVQNSGAAFSLSLGSDHLNRIVFLIISSLASMLLIWLILHSRDKVETIAYSLILGGAIGNLIDRLILGAVTDFIWCDFPDFIMHRWPVFNLADSSIVIAITILIIYSIFGTRPKEKS